MKKTGIRTLQMLNAKTFVIINLVLTGTRQSGGQTIRTVDWEDATWWHIRKNCW